MLSCNKRTGGIFQRRGICGSLLLEAESSGSLIIEPKPLKVPLEFVLNTGWLPSTCKCSADPCRGKPLLSPL